MADPAATPTVLFADPLLLQLAANGGPTRTMALDVGSPAIDHGTVVGAPPIDQRGRPRDVLPDAGSFEVRPNDILIDGFESGDLSAWSVSSLR